LYSTNITVGTPPQTFLMSLDTGSSDIFLPGINCTSFDCNGHKLYNPSASSTAVDMNKTFTISRDGDVTGEIYTDTVTIGDATVTGQAIGYATEYPFDYAYADGVIFIPDGVLGLAFPALSKFGATPLFQNLVSSGTISSSVFSMKLDGDNAELRLGGTNSALFTGEITISYGAMQFWNVELIAAYAGSTQITGNHPAIIDTTNHVVLGEKSSIESAYRAIFGTVPLEVNGSGFYNIPCSWNTTITLSIGGGRFPISPASFNLGPWDGSNPNNCLGGFVAGSMTPGYGTTWILGDVFLRNSYLVFNAD
ncbi:acid protease, partial [Marasmius fiardii PR-910]